MSSILKGLQLNELSNKKLGDYKKAAGADATAADKAGDYKRGDKRMSGIIKATKKEFANDEKKKDVAEAGMPFRGVGGAFNRGDDERHDLDPTEWYVVKDGKMYKTSVYPNQVQQAISLGYSRSREEAKAKADRQGMAEEWSQKYKSSINCSHPKGFSQKAHCAGKKKHNESIDNVMEMTCPDCGMCETHGDNSKDKLDELKCWSGYHRVAGTKAGFPGSCAKNKTNEEGVAEGSDFFAGSKFADEDGNTFSVEKIIAFAKKNPKYFHKDFPLSKIKHDLSWWQGNKERMMNADTSFPLLVIQNDDGHLGVADGLNRMKKAVDVEKKTTIDVYLVPKKDIMKFSEKQGVAEEQHSCPHCGGEMVSEELMNEKKDACYYKVKSRYKVWPSAYASGALVKCRNKGAKNWGNGGKKNESSILEGINRADESLHDWFNKEKWVRMDTKGNIKGPCAREPGEGKPKCLPQSKAHSLGKKGRASAAQRKRREDPNPERSGKAINVNTKKKSNENIDEDWKKKLGAAALAGSMALGAAGASADTRRVTPDGQGGFTGGLKPTATVVAPDNTPSATPPTSDTSDPFKGLARAERADRQAQTITIGGKEYRMVEISPTDIRPRSGKQIVVPQAVLGERGIGTYMGILAGNTVFVISK